MRKGRSTFQFWVVFFFILSIFMLAVSLYIRYNTLLGEQEYSAHVIVDNVAGFDLNKTALVFGAIKPGANGKRSLIVHNNFNFRTLYSIKAEGDIAPLLHFEDRFILDPDETKELEFKAIAPFGQPLGNYSGKVIVEYRRSLR